MKMKSLSTCIAIFGFIALVCVSHAQAQSCQPLIDDLINFAANPQPGTENRIKFQMVANREAADWAQFVGHQFSDPGEGELHYTPGRFIGWFYIPPSLEGNGKQFFSDRVWFRSGEIIGHPFDPDRTDMLYLSFDISPFSSTYGRLFYTPQGSATAASDPQCRNGFLYGFIGDQERPDQMYILTFKKAVVPTP